jgi:hypothetical protein
VSKTQTTRTPLTWQKLLITGALGRDTFSPNKKQLPIGLLDLFSDFLQEVSYLAVLIPFGIIFGAIVAMLVPASYVSTPLSAIAVVCWPLELLALIVATVFVIRVLRFYPIRWLCYLIAQLACPIELKYHQDNAH